MQKKEQKNAHLKTLIKQKKYSYGVDGRHDNDTLLYKKTYGDRGKEKIKKTKRTEHNLTFTKETVCGKSGKYLTHSVITTTSPTGALLAQEVASVFGGI